MDAAFYLGLEKVKPLKPAISELILGHHALDSQLDHTSRMVT